MRNLLYLIFRFSAFLAFLVLELICFYLIVNYNKSQGEIWAHSSNLFVGSINARSQKVEDFFELNQKNDSLLLENARLLETILNFRMTSENNAFQDFEETLQDSTLDYQLIPANVVSKTIHLRNNYLTLSKGKKDGLKVGMGVLGKNGVIGIIKSLSDNYATVLLILNGQSRTSVKILNEEYHGNLVWESSDPRLMNLKDVPRHANISKGDTIVTSGYSISYPANVHLGTIDAINYIKGSNSYDIDVRLDYDLSNISYAYVVAFQKKEEKETVVELQDE